MVVTSGIRVVSFFAAALLATACQPRGEQPSFSDPATAAAAWTAITDLQVTDVTMGEGPPAGVGSNVEVHYEGWLYDPGTPDHRGFKFDSSRERGRPFRFRIGSGMVIRGWDEGVTGMQAGGHRQLVVPAALGYGERGAGGGVIPPGAALIFDIELLRLE